MAQLEMAKINKAGVDKIDSENACVGSKCMAWRWVGEDERRGYCGLVGKP
jgi:hypothetical protein